MVIVWWEWVGGSSQVVCRDLVDWNGLRCPVMAAGEVVVDYCELCALRPRELEVASSMAGWLACSRATKLDRKPRLSLQ